ncbi:hypothetical protein [Vibrio gazogenes]|uniref:Uncharacterized protein n=1 Tax=Vibrio gazogenes TaxID=687 RepID=A0A1Z2SBB8_VIBGA|nr:hypothetical protein [Vibrio gazogenes]ASA54449.1 hypothetical protein BSQ33_01040 [Vibrio gazogenes]
MAYKSFESNFLRSGFSGRLIAFQQSLSAVHLKIENIEVTMPAEKLTKQRLIHIVVILTILVAAFFWRTYRYSKPEQLSCDYPCQVAIDGQSTLITTGKDAGSITIFPAQKSWSIVEQSSQIEENDDGQMKLTLMLENRDQFTLVTGMHKKYIIHIKNR